MTQPPIKASDLDLSGDSPAQEQSDSLDDWEHGFVDAYLFLHHVHGEPTHEQLNRALHALEHYMHTHHRQAWVRR